MGERKTIPGKQGIPQVARPRLNFVGGKRGFAEVGSRGMKDKKQERNGEGKYEEKSSEDIRME